jgi:hypothetical protein
VCISKTFLKQLRFTGEMNQPHNDPGKQTEVYDIRDYAV